MKYILRECFVTSAMHLLLMSCGVALSFPSILAPALTAEHAHVTVTEDELNHIMGAYGLAGPIGCIIFPWTMQRYGRKLTNVLFNVCTISGSIFIAVASNATLLIIGRAFHGLSISGYFIGCTMAAEYTHPKRRGFYIIIKGVSGGIGELLCHSLGLTILSYQQTALLAVVPAVLSILITLRWPESPQYLAYKGRYDECTAAFQWMRGTDTDANKELQELILSQKEQKKMNSENTFARAQKALQSKDFLMPMFIVFWLAFACQCSGFMFLASYVNELVNMMTGNRSQAYYYTLALDSLKIISICVSSVVVRLSKRRSVLFSSGLIACVIMVAICTSYYLNKVNLIALKWLTPSIFVLYYVIVNIAIAPVTVVLLGEIVPIKYKGVGTFFSGMIMMLLAFVVMTYTWKMVSYLDLHGTFGVCLLATAVGYVVLYFFLPETKDRTLQDIENEFANGDVKYDRVKSDTSESLTVSKVLSKT